MGFISDMLVQALEMNVVHFIHNLKNKDHIIISVDARKLFYQIQHLFMIKKKKNKNAQQTRSIGELTQLYEECLQRIYSYHHT